MKENEVQTSSNTAQMKKTIYIVPESMSQVYDACSKMNVGDELHIRRTDKGEVFRLIDGGNSVNDWFKRREMRATKKTISYERVMFRRTV